MHAFSILVLLWTATATGFTGLTLLSCVLFERQLKAREAPPRWPSLWLLRPCEGDEQNLAENLASSLAAYAGERRVLLLVPSATDPSHAIACAVAAASDAVEVVVTDVAPEVRNRKVAQLAVGLARALAAPRPPELIVHADSDVVLGDDTLPSLITALGDDPRIAAAFAAPIELAVETAGDLAASGLLSASHQDLLALASLSSLSGAVNVIAGALIAHRLPLLVETGGFLPLQGMLGEDFELLRRLGARGLRVAISGAPARSFESGRDLSSVVVRTARWTTVVKRQRGARLFVTYPLLLAPTPLLAVAAMACWRADLHGPAFAVAALAAGRVALAWLLRAMHGAPVALPRAFSLWLGAELLMLVASARAAVTTHVVWRGRRLRVLPGGAIVEEPSR